MPTVRKRSLQELGAGDSQEPAEPSMLHRIRNMWQFANLFQFMLLFGQALKLDDSLDIEVRRAPIPPRLTPVVQPQPGERTPPTHMLSSLGFGSRMSHTWVHGVAKHRPGPTTIPVFPPRPDVRCGPPISRIHLFATRTLAHFGQPRVIRRIYKASVRQQGPREEPLWD